MPPSHDPPWLGKRGRSRGTDRKQGGQPGHVGHGRSLFPMERVTEVVEHWPQRCSCGHVFGKEEREPIGAPARHQVAELPPLAVEISEHRLQRLCCPDCGRTVRGELPAGVLRGCFGPKLEAAIAALTVRNRLSRRQLVELLEELFGCPIAVGTIDGDPHPVGCKNSVTFRDRLICREIVFVHPTRSSSASARSESCALWVGARGRLRS